MPVWSKKLLTHKSFLEPEATLGRDTHMIALEEAKIRVLIVDDIPDTLARLTKLIEFESDIEVVGRARSGEEGISMAGELKPDIVLMDINMPGIDGITASEVITQRVPSTQIIIMSIQGEAEYLRRSVLAGAREFLIKPFSGDELVSSIRRVYELGASRRTTKLLPAIESLEELQALERLVAYDNSLLLGRVSDELERITSGIPHDLKEPLGVARNILGDLSELFPSLDKNIKFCTAKLDYALLLVDRLVSVSSCGELGVKTKTSVSESLSSAIEMTQAYLQPKVTVKVEEIPDSILVDVKDADIRQIMVCLLENAIEATPGSGEVKIFVEDSQSDCYIRVLNTGGKIIGPIDQIYELGYTTKPDHAGLGLFACKRIVTQYQGSILVREYERGVIASATLPKEFKQRKRQYKVEDLRKALQRCRNLPLSPNEEDIVRDVIIRILAVFVRCLLSTVGEVELVLSPALEQLVQHSVKKPVHLLRTVLRNCAYVRAIAMSLLEPSQPVQTQPVHLSNALFDVLRLFETKLPPKSVTFRIDDRIWIKADPIQFQRVFFNLARNSLEAMRLQGKFELDVSGRVVGTSAVIRFSDSGIGISGENLEKIFERGFSTKQKGRGLGLFVAKMVIEQHQGGVGVESEEGVGTCFTIHWPIAPQPNDEAADSAISKASLSDQIFFRSEEAGNGIRARSTATSQALDKPQILIVEDDSTWLEFLVRRLQSSHYTIHKTRKVGEAIELVRRNRYSLVLLDWRMPGVGGQGILEAAREAKPDTPIIILSAHGDAEQRSRALELGARAFVDKPQSKKQWDELKKEVLEIVVSGSSTEMILPEDRA
jgi:signal transduction histidine kinase